jgi:hypothetical protein
LYDGLDALWLRRKVGNSRIDDVSRDRYEFIEIVHDKLASTGLSIKNREERRLLDEAGLGRDSEKLERLLGGRGKGDRERGVERELWPERVGRIGIRMERDRRGEAMPARRPGSLWQCSVYVDW